MTREAWRLTADFISPLVSSNPIPSLIPNSEVEHLLSSPARPYLHWITQIFPF